MTLDKMTDLYICRANTFIYMSLKKVHLHLICIYKNAYIHIHKPIIALVNFCQILVNKYNSSLPFCEKWL